MLQDLRYAFRLIRRTPGFALVVILSLALGIGANETLFTERMFARFSSLFAAVALALACIGVSLQTGF